MKNRLTVIATKDEIGLVRWNGPILITGVGALNIMAALADIPRDTPIINIGYCGAGKFPKGTRVLINACDSFHPNVEYIEPKYELKMPRVGFERIGDVQGVRCHTITDFGGDPKLENCVFDMELAFILGMGFTDVMAIKVVSDNCSYEEYEETVGK